MKARQNYSAAVSVNILETLSFKGSVAEQREGGGARGGGQFRAVGGSQMYFYCTSRGPMYIWPGVAIPPVPLLQGIF